MTANSIPGRQPSRLQRIRNQASNLLVGVVFILVSTAIILFPVLPRNPYDLAEGQIAAEDIRAPREITYISQTETEAARNAAREGVLDIYDPPDARVGRLQVRKARQVMAFIRDVRADPFADPGLKTEYLDQVTALPVLSTDSAQSLLTVSDEQFALVESDVINLVEEAMSGTVREGREKQVTDQLELKASPDLPEELIPVAVAVSRQMVVPNSFLNEEATTQARAAAESGVPEIRVTFQEGEVIIQGGEQVDALDREALEVLGLTAEKLSWERAASAALVGMMTVFVIAVYMRAVDGSIDAQPGRLILSALLMLIFLMAGQFLVPGQDFSAYLFPVAAMSMVLTAVVGVEFAAVSGVVLAIISGYLGSGSLEVAAYLGIGSTLAAARLGRAQRLQSFFRAGVYAALGGITVILIFRLPAGADPARISQLMGLSVLNGLLSAGLALVLLYVIGGLTSITTSLQLIDLMRPDHPLQKKLQQEALGTYQHTLAVANLAEAAAESIGARSLLVRVGTLYHDVGKTMNPGFFIENRTEGGTNPHDQLNPLDSARIITAHVRDGLDLARRHRLPAEVTAFIVEHHGTMPLLFFIDKAREEAERAGRDFDESPYYYDGRPPQTRETAILMLADGCESAVRANRPGTTEEIDAIVSRIIQQRIDLRQLDESNLTLAEIRTVKDSFVRTLKGMYHPRVRYPGDTKPPELPAQEPLVIEGKASTESIESEVPQPSSVESGQG